MQQTKTFLFVFAAWCCAWALYAQQNRQAPHFHCGFDDCRHHHGRLHPAIQQIQDSLDAQLSRKLHLGIGIERPKAVVTVPIVFHIVHNNGTSNISNARILTALQQLNDAFANRGTYQTANGVDMEIQFCLAQRDPNGAATTGVTRTVSTLTVMDMNSQDLALKNLIRWNPRDYINVWIVDEIIGGVAGYAYLPGAHGSNVDGIVVEDDWMGNTQANSAVMTHEIGHYFGLYHTFEAGCPNTDCTLNGDRVCDTPPDATTNRPPCNAPNNSCATDADDVSANNPFRPTGSGGLGDQPDMIENYMDYSNFSCYTRLTAGQKVRALFFLNGTRASLLQSRGCQTACTIPLLADFGATPATTTAGSSISFNNLSTGATVYNWYQNGVLFSSATNPSFLFPTAGNYNIVLEASNSDPNCTQRDSIQVAITCPADARISPVGNTVNLGANVFLNGSTSIGANSYIWRINGVQFDNVAITSRTFPTLGSYSIELVVVHSSGCRDSVQIPLTVVCPTQAIISASNPYPNPGSIITLTSASTATTSQTWTINGNVVSSAASVTYTVPSSGAFTACLSATGASCSNAVCQTFYTNTDTNNCGNTFLQRLSAQQGLRVMDMVAAPLQSFFYAGGSYRDSSMLLYANANGTLLWQRSLKLMPGFVDERIDRILVDNTGLLVCIGSVRISPQLTARQSFVLKYDPNTHAVIWVQINATSAATRPFTDLRQAPNGNYAIVGTRNDNALLVNLNPLTGALVSSFEYDTRSVELWSRATQHGGFLYTLGAALSGTAGGQSSGIMLSKLNYTGGQSWTRTYVFNAHSGWNEEGDVVPDGDSLVAFAIARDTFVQGGNTIAPCIHLFKIDTSGNEIWRREIRVPSLFGTQGARLVALPDGYAIGGIAWQTVAGVPHGILIKTDKQGNVLWTRQVNIPNSQSISQVVFQNGFFYAMGAAIVSDLLYHKLNANGQTIALCDSIGSITAISPRIFRGNVPITPTVSQVTVSLSSVTATSAAIAINRAQVCSSPCAENCNNNLDDDGDGFIDCADSECNCDPCVNKTSTVWQMGANKGLDFRNGTPPIVTTNGQVPSLHLEGTAVASDRYGNMLFYTDGISVWTRNHALMPNGTGLTGNQSATQSALVVQHPTDPALYYLFTTDAQEDTTQDGCRYSIVDMRLNGGFGAVTATKNVLLFPNSSEKLVATRHCNGRDVWVVAHENNTNNFRVYSITSAGLNTTPSIQPIGPAFTSRVQNTALGCTNAGWAQFNMAGSKLAVVSTCLQQLNLYDFNNSTGVISNNITISPPTGGVFGNSPAFPYGVEFSPSGQFLYLTNNNQRGFQYDISSNNAAQIQASAYMFLTRRSGFAALKLGPDGKIYVSNAFAPFMGVIDNPDGANDFCNFRDSALATTGNFTFGLPNFMNSELRYLLPDKPEIRGTDTVCTPFVPEMYSFSRKYGACNLDSVVWTLRGSSTITSRTDSTLTILPSGAGVDTIYLAVHERCATGRDTFLVRKFVTPTLALPPDTIICQNGSIPLQAAPGFRSYRWNNGETSRNYTADRDGVHWLRAVNMCGDTLVDSIRITYRSTAIVAVPDTVLCQRDTLRLNLNPVYTYQWLPTTGISCTNCPNPRIFGSSPAQYIAVITDPATGCSATDTFNVSWRFCGDTIRIDTALCTGRIFAYRGNSYPAPSLDTLTWAGARDTLAIINVQAFNCTDTIHVDTVTCGNDAFNFFGNSYNSIGTDTFLIVGGVRDTLVFVAIGLDSNCTDTIRIDTTLCAGLVFQYRSQNYTQNTVDTLVFLGQPRDTLVYLTVNFINGCFHDTIRLDTTLCAGQNFQYRGQNYTQNTTDTLQITGGVRDTTVYLTVRFDTVTATATTSLPVCENPSYFASVLANGNAPLRYLWSNGATTQTIFGASGSFSVTVTDANGCSISIPVVIPASPAVQLAAYIGQQGTQDTTIWQGDTVLLHAGSQQTTWTYQWTELNAPSWAGIFNPTSFSTWASPSDTGVFRYVISVSASANGLTCSESDTLRLVVQAWQTPQMPTAFTPNGDGQNDRFRPVFLATDRIVLFELRNRWGQLMYDNATLSDGGWDGTWNGTPQPRDVYIYTLRFRDRNGQEQTWVGECTLLR